MIYFSKTFAIFLLVWSASAFLQAQTVNFQPLNGPHGVESVSNVASDNSGNLFMVINRQIFHSTDNGDSWAVCMDGIPTSSAYFKKFLLAPSGKFYAQFENADLPLYCYQPATNSWAPVPLPPDQHYADGFDFDQLGRMWASTNASYNKIHYSTDAGVSFHEIPLSTPVEGWFDFLATYNDEHNLIAVAYGTNQKLFHFKSNGEAQQITFVPLLQYLGYNPYSGTAYYSGYDKFKRSADGGLTWQSIILNPAQPNQGIKDMSFEPGGRTWALSNSGNYWSDDEGATWTKDATLSAVDGNFYQANNKDWFVTNSCEHPNFSRSTDKGASWTDLSQQFTTPTVSRILVDGAGSIYAKTCHHGAYERSTDHGATWSDFGITDGVWVDVQSLALRPDGTMMATAGNGKCYRSFNNGNSWEQITNVGQPLTNLLYSNFYTDVHGSFYFFGLSGQVLKSTDGGNSWIGINLWSGAGQQEPAFHPNGDIYEYDGLGSGEIYVASADSIKYLELPGEPYLHTYYVHCTNKGITFLVVEPSSGVSQLYRIMPNGQYVLDPVTSFPGSSASILDITSNVEGDVFVQAGETLYKSEDDGLSWQKVGTLTLNNRYLYTLYVAPDQYLYAGFGGDVIYRSTEPTAENNFVSGKVWLDTNDNCSLDAGEALKNSVAVEATGNGDYTAFSGYNGNYLLTAPSGTYSLNVRPPNALFKPCLADVPLTLDGPNDSATVDLPLRVVAQCPYLSVSLTAPLLRRCFDAHYTVKYKNEGTATASDALIYLTLDSFFVFQNASLPVAAQDGLTYTFLLGDLTPGQSGQIDLTVKISCDASLGQVHCMTAQIRPNDLCLPDLPPRSAYRECRPNVGSFDPNDKRAFVDGIEEPGHLLPNTEIEYLIQFQNTGTDTAFRVVVEDRFSSLLDLSTVTPLVSSHPFTMEVRDRNVLRFVFDNVLLPDSNINEAASHGFIKFRVAQKPDVPLGSTIRNEADIFFDFNTPVRTNQSTLVVGTTPTHPEPVSPYSVNAYPNPFDRSILFEVAAPAGYNTFTLRLFDALGRQVHRVEFSGAQCAMERNGLPSGLYYYRIESNGRRIGAGEVEAR